MSRTQFELNIEMAVELMRSFRRSQVELTQHSLDLLSCSWVLVVACLVLQWSRDSELLLSPRWPGEARNCALREREIATSTERVQGDLELRFVRSSRDEQGLNKKALGD